MELCDKNCKECPLIHHPNSRMLTKILNDAKDKFGGSFYLLVESNCPHMTVCYDCRFDDFTHAESCEFANDYDKDKKVIPPKIKERIEELKNFRDHGDTFMFLGVEHIVVGHSINSGLNIVLPTLLTYYRDNAGKINEYEFDYGKLPLLIKQNNVKEFIKCPSCMTKQDKSYNFCSDCGCSLINAKK